MKRRLHQKQPSTYLLFDTLSLKYLHLIVNINSHIHLLFEISNRFAALENLDTEMDVNKAWETIRENVRFEVTTAVTMMIIIFWEMTPYGSYKNRRFGGSYRLHLQGVRVRANTE
jgi:hypothetical protein